jgi:hypothetical protein
MKYYETQKFIALHAEWLERLKADGFKDIEKGDSIQGYDRRTIAFDNREELFSFFTRLDHFLTEYPEISSLDRQILTLYSAGRFLRDISRAAGCSQSTAKTIIKRYRTNLDSIELSLIHIRIGSGKHRDRHE